MEKVSFAASRSRRFFLLIYAIYVVISLRFYMQVGEREPAALYTQFVKMSLLLLGAGIVLSRNKLKRQEYQFYFLNSAIQSVPFVLCAYFFPVLFAFSWLDCFFTACIRSFDYRCHPNSVLDHRCLHHMRHIGTLYALFMDADEDRYKPFRIKNKGTFTATNDRLCGISSIYISSFSKSGTDDPCMAGCLSDVAGDPSKRWVAMGEGISSLLCTSNVYAVENRDKVIFLSENQDDLFLFDAFAAGNGLFHPISHF